MSRGAKRWTWIAACIGIAMTAVIGAMRLSRNDQMTILSGVVLRQDRDVQKQSSIANAEITAANGVRPGRWLSDSSGAFRVELRPGLMRGQTVTLKFRHPEYEPLDITQPPTDELLVVRMTPIRRETADDPDRPDAVLADVRVRYAVRTISTQNVGSTTKILEVRNKANVPCEDKPPCSPDGKWKATIASASLDAGDGNEIWNARVSCIAGPCPFTRIEYENSSRGGRTFDVSVRNWSDTVTYLLEAEVAHTMTHEIIRRSFPVMLGLSMSFTLPSTAQGLSIEADMDGSHVVFPLGPKLALSWAECSVKVGVDQTKLYRCQLKPGYRFK